MCGIIGIIGKAEVAPLLLEGLKRLEYRGYDSAGIATLVDSRIERRRAEGRIVNLERRIGKEPITGKTGIGHTRWATHGIPNEINAHPHASSRVAVVHNGIIENFQALREELQGFGVQFETDTDTEVIVHLITHYLEDGMAPEAATVKTMHQLEGAFALGVIFANEPTLMIGARRGSSLAIGYGDGEMYLGSDALALAPLTSKITYLEEGDWAALTPKGVTIHDETGTVVERKIEKSAASGALEGKGNYPHFMLKEIFEQPAVIGDTLRALFNPVTRSIFLPDLPFDLAKISRVTIVACGTSFYAALVAKYWLEGIAGLSVEVDIASEFRYRSAGMSEGELAIFISQSGETADTLAALRYAQKQDQHTLALVNVPESTLAREAEARLLTYAGPRSALPRRRPLPRS